MSMTKDVNLGTLLPLALFLTVQTMGGIWWAATITAGLDQVNAYVVESRVEFRTAIAKEEKERIDDLAEETADRIDDRRRIYDRLVTVEKTSSEMIAEAQATAAIIQGMSSQIEALREDVRTNNELLRNLLVTMGEDRRAQRNGSTQGR